MFGAIQQQHAPQIPKKEEIDLKGYSKTFFFKNIQFDEWIILMDMKSVYSAYSDAVFQKITNHVITGYNKKIT